jgi:hypothetical protein
LQIAKQNDALIVAMIDDLPAFSSRFVSCRFEQLVA